MSAGRTFNPHRIPTVREDAPGRMGRATSSEPQAGACGVLADAPSAPRCKMCKSTCGARGQLLSCDRRGDGGELG